MESCQICQFGIRPQLTTRNYYKWRTLIIDHLREHPELLPYLYTLPHFDWTYIIKLNQFLRKSMSRESFGPLRLAHFPCDIWWSIWEAYGDPCDPPSPEDYLPPVTPIIVSSTSDEITPPAAVAPTDSIPAIDASDSVQQDPLCLPTSSSCDEFLPDIARLFVESHIEDVGDIIDDIHLLFEVNTSSFAIVTNSCTSTLQGTHGLPGDDFLLDISALFLESHTADMGDFYDDFLLLFAEENSSTVIAHSLHDQSFQVGVIVDTYVHHLQEVSFTVEKTVGFLKQVLHHSLFDLHFSSVVLEGATVSIDTGTFEQVLVTPIIIEIPSSYKKCISQVPLPLFRPKGRNIIQRSWISFYIGAFLTSRHTTFRGGGLPHLLLLPCGGDFFLFRGFVLLYFSFVYTGCMS